MEQVSAEILGTPLRYEVDGISDDLLTGGLGLAGLRGPPPPIAHAEQPTPGELRRRAIHTAYRGLIDTSEAGGFGRLYGPVGDLRVAGVEYLLAVRTPDGRGSTTVLLQVPRGFDLEHPCLVAVASSGSRGIYGALPTAGDWGLRHGCAVVHRDKGTGIGVWDIDRGRGYRIDGTLTADPADPLLSFAPPLSAELADFGRRMPHSLLFKHANSGLNPEADWGSYLLQAIKVAFAFLNREFAGARPEPLTPGNTIVLAAGSSNGGAAVLRALERDRAGWISGAVALEPNAVVSGRAGGLTIAYGDRRLSDSGIGLYDYTSLHYLYQPCAVLAESDPGAPFFAETERRRPELEAWCASLQSVGVLPAGPIGRAAVAARERLLAAGILPEALRLGHFNVATHLWSAITAVYAAAYARLPPWRLPFGVGFAATDAEGRPRALTEAEAASLWADGNGIPPTGAVSLVSARPEAAASASTPQPGSLPERRAANAGSAADALAFAPERILAHAPLALALLPPGREELLGAVRRGQEEVVMTARLGNRPVLIFHGRADGLIPVNHSSRAYYAINQRDRGRRDELRYYELEHGNHFDAVLALPGFASGYVPLQVWMVRGLDLVYERLRRGSALPPSQVLRSSPRALAGGVLAPLGDEHVGRLRQDPGADAIVYAGGVLSVPD